MNKEERSRYLDIQWVGIGWTPIVKRLDKDLAKIDRRYEIHQIKEKFGGLRYYYDLSQSFISRYPFLWRTPLYWLVEKRRDRKRNKMNALVLQAEEVCWHTCEACGSTEGVTTSGGWIQTLCAKCWEKGVL